MEIALMCLIATLDTSEISLHEMNTYESSVVGQVADGELVRFNLSDRVGQWAEVTNRNGQTGWVELDNLECEN